MDHYTVNVLWDDEAKVYVGTSDDITGLTLEAETPQGLFEAAFQQVPYLIQENLPPSAEDVRVTFRVRQIENRAPERAAGRNNTRGNLMGVGE